MSDETEDQIPEPTTIAAGAVLMALVRTLIDKEVLTTEEMTRVFHDAHLSLGPTFYQSGAPGSSPFDDESLSPFQAAIRDAAYIIKLWSSSLGKGAIDLGNIDGRKH